MGKFKAFLVLIALSGAILAWYSMDNFDPVILKGKKVLITGASTGIGEQLAYQYSKFGASVIIVARREKELQKVASKCRELGALEAHYIVADLSSLEAAKNVHSSTLKFFQGIDIVVLNHLKPFYEYWNEKSELSKVPTLFEVNTFSYINLATLFLPELKKSNGSLIVVSSLTGVQGFPRTSCYSGNKHALHGFFDSLRQDLIVSGHRHLSITLCILGPIDTPNRVKFEGNEKMTWYPIDECALAMIKGGALRLRQMYFPYFVKLIEIAHFVLPDFVETALRIASGEVSVSKVDSFPFNLAGYFIS